MAHEAVSGWGPRLCTRSAKGRTAVREALSSPLTAPAQPEAAVLAAPRHRPVMLDEVLSALAPRSGGSYCDGTFGAGGYTRALLEADPQGSVLAIDRDPDAVQAGQAMCAEFAGRLRVVEGRFGDLALLATQQPGAPFDGIVLDIGVSSMQLDDPARGFSFRAEGPLDMRMAQQGRSAADLVNTLKESELADLIYHYGEERRSRAVARAIVAARQQAPITTTAQLASLVASVVYHKPNDIHPATRTFQALRIAVNDELGELQRALEASVDLLAEGGRLVVVTFHSLEDRMVKQFMTDQCGLTAKPSRHAPQTATKPPRFSMLTRKPLTAGAQELAVNPRARSAKLRAMQSLPHNSPQIAAGARGASWDG